MRRVEPFLGRIVEVFKTKRSRKLERVIGLVLLAGSLVFISMVLVSGWQQFRTYLTQIHYGLLAAAQLCTVVALFLGAIMWALVQRALNLGFGWRESVTIHLVSGLAKYIPGYAWQYIGKAYLSRKRGASSRQILAALLTELVLLMAGGVIALALWRLWVDPEWRLAQAIPLWVWLSVGVTALLSVGPWIKIAIRFAALPPEAVDQRPLWLALGLGFVGWIVFAAATWLLSRSLYPVSPDDFSQHVIALVGSSIIGLLVFVVPAGLGVRESTLSLLLVGVLPLEVGAAVSVLLRLTIVVAELFGAVIVLVLNGPGTWAQIRAQVRRNNPKEVL